MIIEIKSYWMSKTKNEKIIISSLGALSVIIIFYFFLFSPIVDQFFFKKQELQDKKQLLAWMKFQAPKFVQSPDKKNFVPNHLDPVSLIDEQFKSYSAGMSLSKAPNGSIQVSFKEIDFNQLLIGILDLQNKHNIYIEMIEVKKLDKPGFVQASIAF
jgi:general secretion pathway protein M